jgi:hypothetical protein
VSRGLIIVNVEYHTIKSKNTDSDKQSFNRLGGHGGRVSERLTGRHTKRFGQSTKVKIQGRGNELRGGRRSLG